MAKKKNNKLTIDEYISIGKGDIYLYIIITIILLLISLWIHLLVLIAFITFGRTIEKIFTYHNLIKIKKYLTTNNLLDKIGNIDYWNEKNYFLTDNYIIIKEKNNISAIKYSAIKQIYKDSNIKVGKNSNFKEYLHIITNDMEFTILIFTTVLVNENYKDITDYLLKKNPHIEVNEPINNFNFNMFQH